LRDRDGEAILYGGSVRNTRSLDGGFAEGQRLGIEKSSSIVLSYKVKHSSDMGIFLIAYQQLLQRAINTIWDSTIWIDKKGEVISSNTEGKEV